MASRSPPYLHAHWTTQKCQLPERLAIPVLRVAVRGSEIVVTASDADYAMTYHKPASSPQLLARSFPRKEDRRVSMTLATRRAGDRRARAQSGGHGIGRVKGFPWRSPRRAIA